MLYQLSYLGPCADAPLGQRAGEGAGSLAFPFRAVHPDGRQAVLGRWAGDAVALAQPFQKVAVLAALTTEGRVGG